MAAIPSTSSVRPKEFHFPVTVEWLGERRVAAQVEGKPAIEITSPPVFQGSDPSAWSPEDFFVTAAASCLAVTFTGLASRAGLAYTNLSVDGDGVAGKRSDRRFGNHVRMLRARQCRAQAERERRVRAKMRRLYGITTDTPLRLETVAAVPAPAGGDGGAKRGTDHSPEDVGDEWGFGPPGHDRPPVGYIPPSERLVRLRPPVGSRERDVLDLILPVRAFEVPAYEAKGWERV